MVRTPAVLCGVLDLRSRNQQRSMERTGGNLRCLQHVRPDDSKRGLGQPRRQLRGHGRFRAGHGHGSLGSACAELRQRRGQRIQPQRRRGAVVESDAELCQRQHVQRERSLGGMVSTAGYLPLAKRVSADAVLCLFLRGGIVWRFFLRDG